MGLTIIDSMSTLLIMDMKEEYKEARNWVVNTLNFNAVPPQASVRA
jgi:mannosyl-oligosaccharide alpha-1,2-mannosidase